MEEGLFAVAEPFFEDLVAADGVVPDGLGHVFPAGSWRCGGLGWLAGAWQDGSGEFTGCKSGLPHRVQYLPIHYQYPVSLCSRWLVSLRRTSELHFDCWLKVIKPPV